MLARLKQAIPYSLKRQLKRILPPYRTLCCPICNYQAREFHTFGRARRRNAKCPGCGSLERHRLVWLFLEDRTDFFDGAPKRMLHFAPEKMFEEPFRRVAGLDRLTADLMDPSVMAQVDITAMPFPDDSFDVILCSHVLEHVPDDAAGMRECRRVLRPGGFAVFLVPIVDRVTFEDASIVTPRERERVFGQFDHVRRYGPDFANRLRTAGFQVTCHTPEDVLERRCARYAIPREEGPVYFCRK